MTKTNFSFVSQGRNTKKYSHPKPYHVDSTGDFGSFQPFLCELLMGSDSLNIGNFTQLVRNGTMPSPTFGRINCKNDFYFVPMCDIYPAFDALRDHTSINGRSGLYIPQFVPQISSHELFMILACCGRFASYEIYEVEKVSMQIPGHTHGFKMKPWSPQTYTSTSLIDCLYDIFAKVFQRPTPYYVIDKDWFVSDSGLYSPVNYWQHTQYEHLSRANSDYVITYEEALYGEGQDARGCEVRIKLTATGRRLYKIFKGLGFSCEPTNENQVSLLPLLAFYKAWYDHYFIQRLSNWHATSCYGLINSIYTTGSNSWMNDDNISFFASFLKDELCQCWYTYLADFVSANVSTVNEAAGDINFTGNNLQNAPNPAGISLVGSLTQYSSGNATVGSTSSLSLVKLQTINRVQRIFNKRGKYGARVYEYIKKNFGEEVAEDMFKPSFDIANITTSVVVDDTYSSADTVDLSQPNTGQHLGYRGGKGDGLSANKSIERYTAPTAGYYIAMMAIYPDSNWCQGDEGHLYAIGRTTFPTDEFDALGYEYTPAAMIYDNRGEVTSKAANLSGKSFGMLPRHSKYKTKRNLVNGCMELRSTRDSFESFYLDRIVTTPHLYYARTDPNDSYEIYVQGGSTIPDAGTTWFSPLRYPQLGWFNRIFFNSGYNTDALNPILFDDIEVNPIEDNFVIQMNIEYELINSLKPMSQSYDTFDETKDNASSEVTTV